MQWSMSLPASTGETRLVEQSPLETEKGGKTKRMRVSEESKQSERNRKLVTYRVAKWCNEHGIHPAHDLDAFERCMCCMPHGATEGI